MATTDSREMIERWKAEHPDLARGGVPARPAPRPRLAPAPDPAPVVARDEQRAMIERWRQDHPQLVGLSTAHLQAQTQPAVRERERDSERRGVELSSSPLTVLGAFIVGCIIGGIAMTIITGIAFWGFSGN